MITRSFTDTFCGHVDATVYLHRRDCKCVFTSIESPCPHFSTTKKRPRPHFLISKKVRYPPLPPTSYNLAGFLGMFSPIQKPKKVFAPFFKNRKKCVPTVGKLGPGTRQVLPPSLRTFTDFHFFHLWLIDCGSKEEKYRGILPHLRWVLFRSRIEGWYGRKWIKTPELDLDCPKKLPDTIFFEFPKVVV